MGSLPAVRQEGEVLFQDVAELPDQLVSLVREHLHVMIDHLEILLRLREHLLGLEFRFR